MRRSSHRIDTSRELQLQRWAGGYMLVRSKHISREFIPTVATLGDVMDQSFDVYIYNLNHNFQSVNEKFVSFDYLSMASVLNRHACDVFPNEGDMLVKNNSEVLAARQTKITQENILMSDDVTRKYLSIKTPLYNENGKLGGLLGVSIGLEEVDFAKHLQTITTLGMLNSSKHLVKHETSLDKPAFSQRERECLYYISSAKSAKEIALKMGLSYRTIEHYIEKIKNKAGCHSRSDLIDYAINIF